MYNPLPDMPILGCSSSTASKTMMSKIWTGINSAHSLNSD